MMITRFAPSPTGLLHLGHAWSAVLGHDAARAVGGRWLVRIEDIDTGRSRATFVDAILEDLRWLGLRWDGEAVLQSGRREAHEAALARLGTMGMTYPCFCTRADIAAAASAPHGMPGAYPGTCRGLAEDVRRERMGRQAYAVRLDVAQAVALTGALAWRDVLRGEQAAAPEVAGDVVLARKDIGVGYMLAVVVDDAWQEVTRVVRGRDLFEATHTQRLLQALLALPAPDYLHHGLIHASDGRRLAKRDKAETLAALREGGVDGLALADRLRALAPGEDVMLPLAA